MKKIVVDAYLAKNLGDDLFLHILFNRYKDNDVKWIINVYNDEYSKILKEFKNVEVKKRNIIYRGLFRSKILRKLIYNSESKRYDGLVIIGGSIFMQKFTWREQLRRTDERIKNLKKNEKKVFILGANFGPFKDEQFKENYRDIFRNCHDVCFRDEKSYNYFKNEGNVRLGSDVVFTLTEENNKVEDSIGISLIDISDREELKEYSKDYKEKIVEIVNYNIDKGRHITLFSFCEKQGDLSIAQEIYELVKDKGNIRIANYEGDIRGYLSLFGSMEVIIGVRFHSIILSQVFNQGIYPLIYNEKTFNILKDIGLDENYTNIENVKNFNVHTLDKVMYRNKINDISAIMKKSEIQFTELDRFIFKGSNDEK